MIETAYLLQSLLIVVWWIGLATSVRFHAAFQFPGIGSSAFAAFFIPDIAIIATLSLVRAYRVSRDLQLIILGAFGYATLLCVNASILGGGGYLSTLLMLLGLAYNGFLCYPHRMFRTGASSILVNSLKTVIQIVCVWGLALGVIPGLILRAFGQSLIPSSGPRLVVGGALFVLFSALGLRSSWVMVTQGHGTPLPLDQTSQLVTNGPYRYVRNPMAVAGIGQGLAVSLIHESLPLLVYALLGACVWHWVVRPIEEQDMLQRFGTAYRAYQRRVRCWIPHWNADAAPPEHDPGERR